MNTLIRIMFCGFATLLWQGMMPGNLSAQDSQSIIDGLLDDLVKQRQLPSREEAETQTKPPSTSKQIPEPDPEPELQPEPKLESESQPEPASVKPSLGMVQVINRSDRNAVLRLFSDELRVSGRVIPPGKLELWSGLPAAERLARRGQLLGAKPRRPAWPRGAGEYGELLR